MQPEYSGPASRRRRTRSRYLVLTLIAFVFLIFLSGRFSAGPRGVLQSGLHSAPHPPSYDNSLVLQPGQHEDISRARLVPDRQDISRPTDPQTESSLHNQRNEHYYLGGLSTLTYDAQNGTQSPVVFDPYPKYNSAKWKKLWKGEHRSCEGPRGTILNRTSLEDMISVYRGNQKGFPFPEIGSHEALGLDSNVCADRCSRWAIYGHEELEYQPTCQRPPSIQWDKINWDHLQRQCKQRNTERYRPSEDPRPGSLAYSDSPPYRQRATQTSQPATQSRTAVIIRTWHGMKWSPNDVQYVRSLIMELSLHSGAEFEVFVLVDVRDLHYQITEPPEAQRVKDKFVPKEFHNMTVLFNEHMLSAWYPKIGEHQAWLQHLQPVQIFAQKHPQFDYYWQFELDSRNTGHTYHFLRQAENFAKEQPRKYLWERNAYFYIPGAYGTWSDFRKMVHRALVGKEHKTVWGPVPFKGVRPFGPKPPVSSPMNDDYQWGVGEEADLITFLPMFDPRDTPWVYPNVMWGLPKNLPRRASVITMWRMSAALLDSMHNAQRERGHGLISEMSAPTWALLHGLKAVHVPQPVYIQGKWKAADFAKAKNRGVPENMNGGPDSSWHADEKHYFSYMCTAPLAQELFRRWLGIPADTKMFDGEQSAHDAETASLWHDTGPSYDTKYGRHCYPPMFLHPVKETT